MFGHQVCGTGMVVGMCGEPVCGLVHLQVITHGTVVAGTTRQVVVGTTVAVTGVKSGCWMYRAIP